MTTDQYIDQHKEEMLEDLKKLVRIQSMRGQELPGKPFGEGPAQALAAARELMEAYGFRTKNYDNYVVTGDLNEKEKELDILAHLDVVPVTPDWTVTQPFEPKVIGKRIYGRGTADDKGPAIAALYAMRAIKECGISLKKNVRLILGADEECGSGDLAHYYALEEEAPATFTPDADFPVINLEKGRLEKEFGVSFETMPQEPCICSVSGGDQPNVVPGNAQAVVSGVTCEEIQSIIGQDTSGVQFTAEPVREGVRIRARGLAAHASTPELGKNTVCALLELLLRLPLADGPQTEALKAVARMFPYKDTAGAALHVAMEDEISGALTMNLGILRYDEENLKGMFDSRIPICGNDGNVTKVIREEMEKHGFWMEQGAMTAPHHVPADSPLVKTLLESYERYTGRKGETRSLGGGTYVHNLKRGVAFGCMMDDVDNHMHGDDEFMMIDVLLISAKIFADAICRLCGTEE